jgi:hypothetical protein
MKTILTFLCSLAISASAFADKIIVKVVDEKGLPVLKAKVVAILKSGAFQNAKLDPADEQHKCEPTEECVKLYAAATGFEGVVKKYSGTPGVVMVQMKASAEKNSSIGGKLEGIDGSVSTMYNSKGQYHMGSDKIGFAEKKGGRPVGRVDFELNRAIDVVTSTGQKFKIWVLDITPQVALLEYSNPK